MRHLFRTSLNMIYEGSRCRSTKYQKVRFFFRKHKKLILKRHTPHFQLKCFQIVYHRFRTCLQKFSYLIFPLRSVGPQHVLEHVSLHCNMIFFFSYYSLKCVKYYGLKLTQIEIALLCNIVL